MPGLECSFPAAHIPGTPGCLGWHILLPYVPSPGLRPPVPVSGELPSTGEGVLISLQPWQDVGRRTLISRMHLDTSAGKAELGFTFHSDFLLFPVSASVIVVLLFLSCSEILLLLPWQHTWDCTFPCFPGSVCQA